MQQPVNEYIRDAFIKRGTRITRTEAALIQRAADMLETLSGELSATLASINLERGTSAAKLARLEKLKTKIDKIISGTYSELDDYADANGLSLAQNEIAWLAQTINGALGIEIVEISINKTLIKQLATDVMIQGAPSSSWWYKQGKDLSHKFMSEMRMGIMQGEGLGELTRRVRGRQENKFADGLISYSSSATRNAEALIRTSAMTVLNATRDEIYQQNEDLIKGIQSLATLDLRTTPVCRAYDGALYDLDYNPIMGTKLPYLATPRHWSCRSLHIPLLYSFAELAKRYGGNTKIGRKLDKMNESTRSSLDGQISDKITYGDWLRTYDKNDPAGVKDMLGASRYELWKSGKYDLADFINSKVNQIPLEDL